MTDTSNKASRISEAIKSLDGVVVYDRSNPTADDFKRLEAEIKHWQDKEVEKASCCVANEEENVKLKQQLEMCKKALEFLKNDLDLIAVTPTEISHLEKCKNTLAEIEGVK